MDSAILKDGTFAEMTVNDVIRLYPHTVTVFSKYGIDACCGGALQVAEAARRHGVELSTLLAALTAAAGEDV